MRDDSEEQERDGTKPQRGANDTGAGRAALGMLAGTPLGEAEIERMERERENSVKPDDGKKRRSRGAKGQQPEAGA